LICLTLPFLKEKPQFLAMLRSELVRLAVSAIAANEYIRSDIHSHAKITAERAQRFDYHQKRSQLFSASAPLVRQVKIIGISSRVGRSFCMLGIALLGSIHMPHLSFNACWIKNPLLFRAGEKRTLKVRHENA
jgi:hypothetical protein